MGHCCEVVGFGFGFGRQFSNSGKPKSSNWSDVDGGALKSIARFRAAAVSASQRYSIPLRVGLTIGGHSLPLADGATYRYLRQVSQLVRTLPTVQSRCTYSRSRPLQARARWNLTPIESDTICSLLTSYSFFRQLPRAVLYYSFRALCISNALKFAIAISPNRPSASQLELGRNWSWNAGLFFPCIRSFHFGISSNTAVRSDCSPAVGVRHDCWGIRKGRMASGVNTHSRRVLVGCVS